MNAPLEELYFNWLYNLVADPQGRTTYWKLLKILYTKECIWLVPNDDNRLDDGRYLRYEFADSLDLVDVDPEWMQLECCFFELLIGLSRRLSFLGEGEPSTWFWHMLANLGIHFHDRQRFRQDDVEGVLDNVLQRRYEYDGTGGLFPLKHPRGDQKAVELWSQLNAYLLEH